MNALELAQKAVALWRSVHGDQSLYLFCQRFDGYYVQWAYQGDDNIIVYPSAAAAARDSAMFTTDVNASSVQPGDLVYWVWGQYGHVASVIGRDGDRTLVTHTANSGDRMLDLGNNVRVSHADTLPLQVWGVSRTNGRNRPRTGLTAYTLGQPAAPAPQPAPAAVTDSTVVLPEAWFVFPTADAAITAQRGHRGPVVGAGTYVVRGQDRGAIRIDAGWLHPKAQPYVRGAQPAPAPSAGLVGKTLRLGSEQWFWYQSDTDAVAERNVRGGRFGGGGMLTGDYRVNGEGAGGALYVTSQSVGRVWVSPKARGKVS